MSDLPAVRPEAPRLPSLARHLEPERLVRKHGTDISKAYMYLYNHGGLGCAHTIEAITTALANVPSDAVLAAVSDDIGSALAVKPSRSANAASVAILFDSRARQPVSPAMYAEALTYDLADEGFAPCVVVAACQHLRRTMVFCPEIAEVLEACRKIETNYKAIVSNAGRMFDERQDAVIRLEQLKAKAGCDEPRPRPAPDWNPQA